MIKNFSLICLQILVQAVLALGLYLFFSDESGSLIGPGLVVSYVAAVILVVLASHVILYFSRLSNLKLIKIGSGIGLLIWSLLVPLLMDQISSHDADSFFEKIKVERRNDSEKILIELDLKNYKWDQSLAKYRILVDGEHEYYFYVENETMHVDWLSERPSLNDTLEWCRKIRDGIRFFVSNEDVKIFESLVALKQFSFSTPNGIQIFFFTKVHGTKIPWIKLEECSVRENQFGFCVTIPVRMLAGNAAKILR